MQLYRRSRLYRPPGTPRLVSTRAPRGLKLAFLPDFFPLTELLSGRLAASFGDPIRPTGFPYGTAAFLTGPLGGAILPAVPTNVFSLEVYLYIPTSSVDGRVLCSFTANDPPGSTYDRVLWLGANTPRFQIFTGSSVIATAAALSPPCLAHIVGVSDGTNIYLYVNGILADTQTGGTAYAGNAYFAVGETGAVPDAFVHIAPVQIIAVNYAEVAWSAAEVLARFIAPLGFYEWPSIADYVVGYPSRLLEGAQQIPAFGQAARFGVTTVNDADLPIRVKPIILVEFDVWQ